MSETKRRGRLIAGGLGLVLAAFYLHLSSQLPMGRADRPGAGVFPIVVGVLAAVISLSLVVESLFSAKDMGHIKLPRGRGLRNVLIFAAATTLLIIGLPYVGLCISAFVYTLLLAKVLGAKGWVWPPIVALGSTGVVAWAFLDLFAVPMTAWPTLTPGM